ncbi:MAG: hypothetical protein QOK29_1008 [Rhodospirillaceae bacterium]|nr:hypothetical protein [Rhodospirillaceae bacterium]
MRPLTVNPRPWGTPTIRPDHPRLYIDATRLQRLRSRWSDPAYAPIVRLYLRKSDPLSLALNYLAIGDSALCHAAAATAVSEPYKIAGPPAATYGDVSALVFDWCYAALSPAEKTALVALIEANNRTREEALGKRFQWHEAHYTGFQAYLLGVLAIEGEPGASHRLAKAQNAIQNFTELGNEVHGDGTYKTYAYQDLFLATPSILWSVATGQDAVRRNQYLIHRSEVLLRLLSADGSDFIAGSGDQVADSRGMLPGNQRPSALGPLMLADYLQDGVAQYTGELIRRKQGWSRAKSDPQWLALLYYNDALKPVPPTEAALTPVRFMPVGGMVNMRSGWNMGAASASNIDAWFYAGPRTEHAEPDVGHFIIRRGDDDLIVDGANYFGSPSKYKDMWGGLSFARNTMVFSPAGAPDPDRAGSQRTDIIKERSAERFPLADRLIWHSAAIGDSGEISDFSDDGRVAMATGEGTAAYDPRYVKSYSRTMIYARPNVFILRDRFAVAGVDRIRMLIRSRERPQIPGLQAIRGSADAGILEAQGNTVTILRGQSQATIQILSPASVKIRAVGGPGYENYIDGADVDPASTAQDWLRDPSRRDLSERLQRIRGQWRVEFETTPDQARGEMIAVISVGPRDDAAPAVTLGRAGGEEIVSVTKAGDSPIDVHLPEATDSKRLRACGTERGKS